MKGFRPQASVAQPVERRLTSQRVYDELRRAIMHGELAAGTSLGETQVGTQLGVSRTPVREAFAELLNQGLLEEGARRQVVIANPSPEVVDEVVLMRDALEPVLARRAAPVMDVSAVDLLRLVMIRAERAARAHDAQGFLDCDDDFHLQIPRGAGLHLAEDALRRLRGVCRLAAHAPECDEWDDDRFARITREHEAVIDAVSSGRGQHAAQAMQDHLAASKPY